MVSLIAVLSSGKGTWGHVSSLMNSNKWKKVYLICNEFAYENFKIDTSKVLKLKFDEKNPEKSLEKLSLFFKKEIKDFEIALNLVSGTGIEHMMLISSLLKAGLGIRFVYIKNGEIKEFEILNEKFIPEDYVY